MKLPVISKKSKTAYYPVDKICPICGTDRTTLNSEFYVLNGGVLKKNGKDAYTMDKDLIGFLSLYFHPGENSSKNWHRVDIVDGATNGQFDIHFCSIQCLRIFFDNIISKIEAH